MGGERPGLGRIGVGAMLAAASVLALGGGACGSAAVLHLKDGMSVEGEILGRDGPYVVVATGPDARRRERDRTYLERRTIASIDHPGEGAILGGAILAGLGFVGVLGGVLGIIVGQGRGGGGGAAFGLIGVIPGGAFLAAGIPTLVSGLGRQKASKLRAYRLRPPPAEAGPLAPPPGPSGPGITARWTF